MDEVSGVLAGSIAALGIIAATPLIGFVGFVVLILVVLTLFLVGVMLADLKDARERLRYEFGEHPWMYDEVKKKHPYHPVLWFLKP